METLMFSPGPVSAGEPRWSRMILLSVAVHLAVFSTLFLAPRNISYRPRGDVVYQVDLVEMPKSRKRSVAARKAKGTSARSRLHRTARVPASRRIAPNASRREKPVVIAKRTLKRKKNARRTSPAKLIDRAVARIERKVRAEKEDPLDRAVSKIRKRVDESERPSAGTTGQGVGVSFQLYMMRVEEWIKANWSYPTAMTGDDDLEAIQAVVLLEVKSDGTILNTRFLKRSGYAIFDDSVMKAIDKSNPLPPFPPGYLKSRDEIEINFNLSELAGG